MSGLGPRRITLAAVLVIATGLFAYGVLRERALNQHGESGAQHANETAAIKATESPAKRASESPATKATENPATKATESPAKRASESPATKASESPAKRASEHPATQATGRPATLASATPATKARQRAARSRTAPAGPASPAETPTEHSREGRILGVDLESPLMIVLAILTGLALAILAASPTGTIPTILLALALALLAWSALDIRDVVHQANESRTDLAVVDSFVAVLHAAAAALAISIAWRPARSGSAPGTGRQASADIAPV